MTSSSEDLIDLGPWAVHPVALALTPLDRADERGSKQSHGGAPPGQQPRVEMPRSTFACVDLSTLATHPAIDDVVRAELAIGLPFRLVRFPFALWPPATGRVSEARFTVQLLGDGPTGPYVHSIFPQRLQVDGDELTTDVAIEPKLSIGSASASAGRLGRKIVVRHAKSTTVGFWSETGAEWVVRPPGEDDGLEGTWEFLVVVRWAGVAQPLSVALGASATVSTGRGLPWRTKRVERSYGPVALTGCVPIA